MKTNFEENVYALIEDLKNFDYRIESIDHIWDIIFLDHKDKFNRIGITKYHDTFYLGHVDGNLCMLEIQPKKSVEVAPSHGFSSYDDGSHDPAKAWNNLISSARKWLNFVKKDWVKANKQVHESYPLNRRYGIAPNALIRCSLSDIYQINEEVGKAKTKKFIRLVEEGYFHSDEKTTRKTISANDYFEYCKIAYLAGQRKDDYVDKDLSGREMYERYADGRHEGLLDIDPTSETEFADWIDGKHPKKSTGGHPWEIKRGGNTTHINLSVSRPSYYRNESFKVSLCGASIGRLKETICMFLALSDAGFPVTISDPEGIRRRLLGQDNIGIIPSHHSLHRANQHFHEHDHVYDVLHLDDLGRYKRRIKPFITWEPLPILKPVS